MNEHVSTADAADVAARRPSSIKDGYMDGDGDGGAQARQYLDRAYAHVDAGELEDALQECDRAIALTPVWAEAHNLQGVVLDDLGRLKEAIAAYEEAVRLDAGFEDAAENLAEAQKEMRGPGPKWMRPLAFGASLLVLIALVVAFARLEARRGPNWRLELEEYVAHSASPSETVAIQSVVEAKAPHNFRQEMGTAARDDWRWGSVQPSFPPEAVRCVLLERSRPSTTDDEQESTRQVVFLAYHTDALYRVGWLAYAGPEEPFPQDLAANLAAIGCDSMSLR